MESSDMVEQTFSTTVNEKTVEATLDVESNKVTSLTVDGKKCDITKSGNITVKNSDNNTIFTATTTDDGATYIITPDIENYKKLITNLEDVAIDNSNGTIVLKAGGTIDDINKTDNIDSIIQGGTIDISDLVDWTNDEVTEKDGKPNLNIKSAFYNVNIKLIPDTIKDTSNLINYFNTSKDFNGNNKYLFENMKFFSDIKGSNEEVIETRHSTVSMPGSLSVSDVDTDKRKYNTTKPVISAVYFNRDNVLKLFYTADDITDDFYANLPLFVNSTSLNFSLYDFLSNPTSYVSGLTVDDNNQLTEEYSLDLIPLVKDNNNIIDYSKFDEIANENLKKIQFVSKKGEQNLNLTLLPSYVMDGDTKVEDTTISIDSTYNGWGGLIEPNSGKIKLSDGTYKIKAHEYLSIETVGNVNLYIDYENDKRELELSLCELSSSNGMLSVFQNSKNDKPLTIKLAAKDYMMNENATFTINAPISVQFVKDDVIHTTKVYREIKDLINDYIKTKVAEGDTNTKYEKISNNDSGVEKKLEKVNELLTEIEDSTSTTDYSKYFKAIGDDGKIPTSTTGIKQYTDIKDVQNKLLQINKYKIEILQDYLGVLNHYVGTLADGDPKTIIQGKIDTINTNINKAIANQLKMLKNKYYNVTGANTKTDIVTKIYELSGEKFPPKS